MRSCDFSVAIIDDAKISIRYTMKFTCLDTIIFIITENGMLASRIEILTRHQTETLKKMGKTEKTSVHSLPRAG